MAKNDQKYMMNAGSAMPKKELIWKLYLSCFLHHGMQVEFREIA